MPVVAPLIGAVASVGGAVLASGASKSAAKTAAAAQTAADDKAIAYQQRQYDQTRSDLAPYRDAGSLALGQQGNLLGLNGGDQQTQAIAQLKASPLYASLFGNGQDTLLANASATGGLRGGNTQGALANFGRDTLASVFQNQISNLGGVATSGQNAAAQTGSLGQLSAQNITNLTADQGSANAGAALAAGRANADLIAAVTGQIGGLSKNSAIQTAFGKLF